MRVPLGPFFAVLAVCVTVAGGVARAADPRAVLVVHVRAGAAPSYAVATAAGCREGLPEVLLSPLDERTFEARRFVAGVSRTIVFVPGYATSVPTDYAAVLRIEKRLGPSDRVILVDWGSAGRITEYDHDAHTARRTAPYLAHALIALKHFAPSAEIDIFAHSLGTRMVAMAIPTFPHGGTVVENAVLAAPDMTLADYTRAIARIPGPIQHITLYVSRHDRALLLSEVFHLRRRLGQITNWSRALANTEVVDASVASHGHLGHNYATTNPLLIDDIGATLASAPTPHPMWHTHKGAGTSVWEFAPPTGSDTGGAPDCTSVQTPAIPPVSSR